jgi:hypothetical protein
MPPASSSGTEHKVWSTISWETLTLSLEISLGGIMKNVQRILSMVAVLATLAAMSLVSVYSVAQDKKSPIPTRKELVTPAQDCKRTS